MLQLAQFTGLAPRTLTLLTLAAVVLLAFCVFLRSRSAGKYEIKPGDLLVAVVPLVLWMVATGKVKQVSFAGVELRAAEAFLSAAEAPVESVVARDSQEDVEELISMPLHEAKGSTEMIPLLLEQRVPQLDLHLGRGWYDPGALREYFQSPWGRTWFQWCVILDGERLFGVVSARDLIAHLEADPERYERYAEAVSSATDEDRTWLRELPGFLSGEIAATPATSKRAALELMTDHGSAQWPVVDASGRYIGLVDRTDVTTSLLLQVAEALEQTRP